MEKVIRNPQEIQQEYNVLCAQAGEKAYQVSALQKDLRKINARIRIINIEMGEAIKIAKAEQEAAAAAKAGEAKDEAASAQ